MLAVGILENGKPYSFEGHEPLRGIASDMFPNKILMKPAQIGATLMFLLFAIWTSMQNGGKYIYYLPNDDFVSIHVKSRIKKLFDQSEYFNNQVVGNITKAIVFKSGGNYYTLGLMSIMGGHSLPADKQGYDEFDLINQDNAIEARERIEASDNPGRDYFGYPSVPGVGIHRFYSEQSDMREYMLTCPHCGKASAMDWFAGVVEKVGDYNYELLDTNWDGTRDINVYCLHCQKPLNRSELGFWQPTREGKFEYHGYHITRLCYPRYTVETLWTRFNNAITSGHEGEITNFYTKVLGLPYAAAGSQLTVEDLDNARGAYTIMDKSTNPCAIGIDTHNKISSSDLNYVISEIRTKRVITAGITNWTDIDQLWNRYNIVSGVIDSRPETSSAKALQKRHPNIYLAEFKNLGAEYYKTEKKEGHDNTGRYTSVDLVHIDRTEMLDHFIADIRKGFLELPSNARLLGATVRNKDYNAFYEQLMSPVRTYEEVKISGTVSQRAVYRSGGDDHYCFAGGYANVASAIGEKSGGIGKSLGKGISNKFKV